MQAVGTVLTLDIAFFVVAIPAVLFAGVSKGGFGSGAAFASAVLLALVIPPAQALAVMLPLLMVMDVTALKPYWRKWDKAAAWRLTLGAVPGVAIGAAVVSVVRPEIFALMIGAIALSFVAFQLARQVGWLTLRGLPTGPVAGLTWGAAAGFTSFISHAGGPPAAVYLLSRKITKEQYQATTVIVFWIVNMMKFLPYAALGAFSGTTLLADLILAPVAIAGIWLGVWLHRRIPEAAFFVLTYVLLTVSGGRLVWNALT